MMHAGGQPYEWLMQADEARPASGGLPSCSPTYRNVQCGENGPDLETTYNGCRTTHEIFLRRVALTPDVRSLGWRPINPVDGTAGPYMWETYREVGRAVDSLAQALTHAGVTAGDHIGVYGINSPEWVKAMIACSTIRAVCVPLYDTLGAGAIQYVMRHADMSAVFVAAPKLHDITDALAALAANDSFGSADGDGGVTDGNGCSAGDGDAGAGGAPTGGGHGGGAGPVRSSRHSGEAVFGGRSACSGKDSGGAWHGVRHVIVWGVREGVPLPAADVQACERAGARVWRFEDLVGRGLHYEGGQDGSRAEVLAPADPEDICTIYYTSGTTGPPKGVLISHRALVSVVSSQLRYLLGGEKYGITAKFEPEDAHLSYLPLAHIYERAVIEGVLALGAHVGFWQGDVKKLQDDAQQLRPAFMVGVPRVWERVMMGALDKIAKRPLGIASTLYSWLSWYKQRRMVGGVDHAHANQLGDKLMFTKVKAALGGRLKIIISGAAPLTYEYRQLRPVCAWVDWTRLAPHAQTEMFVRTALCCYAGQGYGLTETCSATAAYIPDRIEMVGTVGPVCTCAEFRLESAPELGYDALAAPPQGELLVRGPCLFSGYNKMPEETAKVLDADGFFRTGDIMELTPSGALRIIDRRKNIFKLSQGEYVPVERVETCLKSCPLVNAVWVHGEPTERHPVAVVVPREDRLMAWANATGMPGSFEVVCATPEAHRYVLEGLTAAGHEHKLRGFEMVAGVVLEPEEFTVDGGLVTPTYKLKRHELRKHYAVPLAKLYKGIRSSEGGR